MKKSDLRTGHIVTLRSGDEYIVVINCNSKIECGDFLINAATNSWDSLDCYMEDLTYRIGEGYMEERIPLWDIVKVELPNHPYAVQNMEFERLEREVLWERNKEQELDEKEEAHEQQR